MDNKKVPTILGTIIILIIALTVGWFVWRCEEKNDFGKIQIQKISIDRQNENNEQNQQENENKVEIVNSKWKKYTSSKGMFSVEYPAEWQISGSVFLNKEGYKIAEFLPGLVIMKPSQKCFNDQNTDSSRTEMVSRNNITIGKQQGVLLITRSRKNPGGGFWFSKAYCMYGENKAFIMSFYENELSSDKKELFEKIIATLKF